MEYDDDDFITCKVVLIGESGVGKTSIIHRYINNVFNPGTSSTGGANFTTKRMKFEEEKNTIKFEIWDTAGQERFRSLAKVFYKNAAICVLVYDITRKETFEELEKFWVEEIKNSVSSEVYKFLFYNFYFLYF
jgi:Ras-related protein Rab-5C